jgi:two-component system sensor histidine kinase YesM
MRLRDMKLKYKILLTNLTVLALVITVLILSSNQMFISYFVDETQKNLDREQQLIVQNQDTIFNSSEDYIRLVACNYNLQQSMKELRMVRNTPGYAISKVHVSTIMGEIMSSFIHPVTHIIGGAIIEDGEVIYSGYDISSGYVERSLPEGFLAQIKEIQRPVWSGLTKLEYAHSASKNVVMVGKSIIDKNTGKYLGECVFFVDEAVIESSFSSVKNLNSNLYITDYTYKIISCADRDNIGQNLHDVLNNDYFETQTLNESNVKFTGTNLDKNVYSVTSYPRMKWYIVNTASYETAGEKSNRTNDMILLTGLGCVCIYFLSSFLIDYTMIKPINSIATSMSKVGKGDLSIRETRRYSGEMQVIATNFNVLMDKIESLIQEVYQQQKMHRENEFKILQAQINPHFLYNTIETIISFITLDMKKEATAAAMSLAEFYKLSLSKGKSIITVQEELKLTLNYIKLQKLRYEDYFDFEVNVDKDLDYCYIPKLTLQPLVENAIYHGIRERSQPGKIVIKGYQQNDTAVLEVYDNGSGIDPAQIPQLLSEDRPQKTVFFGLANVDQRIKHKYGHQYGLHIESEKGSYTKVTVTLPINRSEAEI